MPENKYGFGSDVDELKSQIGELADVGKQLVNLQSQFKNGKYKIEFDINTSDVEKATQNLDAYLRQVAQIKQVKKMNPQKFYESLTNGSENVVKAWNKILEKKELLSDWKNGKISGQQFFRDKDVSEFWRRANAYEARGGDLSSISGEVSNFTTELRSIYDGFDKSLKGAFPETVDNFQKMFGVLDGLAEKGFDTTRFKGLNDSLEQARTKALSLKEVLDSIGQSDKGNSSGESAGSGAGAGFRNDSDQVEKMIERTKEEIRQLAEAKREFNESDFTWEFEDIINDIQALGEKLDELKQKREEALEDAKYWYDRAVLADGHGDSSDKDKFLQWSDQSISNYQNYANQVEYLQSKLESAAMSFDASAIEGDYSKAFTALITLMQMLVSNVKSFTTAIGQIDDGNEANNLINQFKNIKTAIDDIRTSAESLKTTMQAPILNLSLNGGKNNNPIKVNTAMKEAYKSFLPMIQSINTEMFEYLLSDSRTVSGLMDISGANYLPHFMNKRDTAQYRTNSKFGAELEISGFEQLSQIAQEAGVNVDQFKSRFQEAMLIISSKSDELQEEAQQSEEALSTLFSGNKIDLTAVSDQLDILIDRLETIANLTASSLGLKEIFSINENGEKITNPIESNGEVKLQHEAIDLSGLRGQLSEINGLITTKNNLFLTEAGIVSNSVYSEISVLSMLYKTLSNINTQLTSITEQYSKLNGINFSAVVDATDQIAKNSAKTADDSKSTVYESSKKGRKGKKGISIAERQEAAEAIRAKFDSDVKNGVIDQAIWSKLQEAYDAANNLAEYVYQTEEKIDGVLQSVTYRYQYDFDKKSAFMNRVVSQRPEETEPAKENRLQKERDADYKEYEKNLRKKYSLLERREKSTKNDPSLYEDLREANAKLSGGTERFTSEQQQTLTEIEEALKQRLANIRKNIELEKRAAEIQKEKNEQDKQAEKDQKEIKKNAEKEAEKTEREAKKKAEKEKRETERRQQDDKQRKIIDSYQSEKDLLKQIGDIGVNGLKGGPESLGQALQSMTQKLQERFEIIEKRTFDDFDPKLQRQMQRTVAGTQSKYSNALNKYVSDVYKGTGRYQQLLDNNRIIGGEKTNYKKDLGDLNLVIGQIQEKIRTGIDITNPQELEEVTSLVSKMEQLNKTLQDTTKIAAKDTDVTKLQSRISSLIQNNPKMSSDMRKSLEGIRDGLNDVNQATLDQATAQVNRFENELIKANKTGDTFSTHLVGKLREISAYIASYVSLREIWNQFKQGLQIIHDLDDALTEMAKVSEEPLSRLQAFQTESYNIANAAGTTGLVIQQSTADFMRLGQSLDQAQKSAKNASVLLNVSEFSDISEATDALIAMSAAYDDISQEDILDKLNNIGNNFSISTEGLATALQNSAATLRTAGNDIDESIALITAGKRLPETYGNICFRTHLIALTA